jgi:hypothetical protein
MRRALLLFALGAGLVLTPGVSHAAELYSGTIVSAGSTTNNGTTAAPFTLPQTTKVLVQCDAASYLAFGTSSVTVTANNGLRVEANATWDSRTTQSKTYVAILPVSGSSNCKVFTVE